MTRDVSQIGFYVKKCTGFHGVISLGLGGGFWSIGPPNLK